MFDDASKKYITLKVKFDIELKNCNSLFIVL